MRKAGRNKTRKKQREYKDRCRTQRLAGFFTDANGQWTQAVPGGIQKSAEELRKMTCAK